MLKRLIRSPNTHPFQKGAWVRDPQTNRFHLVGLVNVCRFNIGELDPSDLRVLSHENIPTDYKEYARSTQGNALGCFIISTASKGLLEELFGKGDVADHLAHLMRDAPTVCAGLLNQKQESKASIG